MQAAMTSIQNQDNASEVFAIVQQVLPQINKDHIPTIADKASGLDVEEVQLVVDLLGAALEKSHHLLRNPERILLLLASVASSSNILSRNRIISTQHITANAHHSDVYKVSSEPPGNVKVVERGKKTANVFSEGLVAWAHLSHTNILPVYGAFLEGDDGPISLVSPWMTTATIVDHAKMLPQAARMPLIFDVIDGMCYLHHLNIVHGALNPKNVLISREGRALIIGSFESQNSKLQSIRYSAPETLDEIEADPKPASDMWSIGCVIYEALSGKVPYYPIPYDINVGIAIATGKKPARPSQNGKGVEEIRDVVWRPVSSCWEFEAKDRPNCIQLRKVFSSLDIHDERPALRPIIQAEAFTHKAASTLNLDLARSLLMRILGSDMSMPLPSQVPEYLQEALSGLADDLAKTQAIAVAATNLGAADTQILVDIVNLVLEENRSKLSALNPAVTLLRKIMVSTHIFPQRYKIDRIQYGPTPLAEGEFGKVYKGRDRDVCVSVVTNSGNVSSIVNFLTLWAHSSHPNVIPFYGLFNEFANEVPRFCLVTPHMKNGLLRDYASRLAQNDRLPLITDVVNALVYLQGLNITYNDIRGDKFLISDEGRAMIDGFGPRDVLTSPANTAANHTSEPYVLRFYAPERAVNNIASFEASAWSCGCLLFEILSRKPPYHQYAKPCEIRSALARREVFKRPDSANDDIDQINNKLWDLVMGCCKPEPGDRLTLLEIQKVLGDMGVHDDRPEAAKQPDAEALSLRYAPDINWDDVKRLFDRIQIEPLRISLQKLLKNRIKDVAEAIVKLKSKDIRTLVDFLDLALKENVAPSDERNRVLAVYSRITTSTLIFPNRYGLNMVKLQSSPIAEGSFGKVYRGASDPDVCIKVMGKAGTQASMDFIKELGLWAHVSHPNVLPFYGVFVDYMERICLVSPFMNKGNLHGYAPQLAQNDRFPLLQDVSEGLVYLHGLGIVHTDLKGENVLISDEGRALITDFGASHVITATTTGAMPTPIVHTLRFSAPEIILYPNKRPTQECDIWSFGCLCYEVLSRMLPYFEYSPILIPTVLSRGELPKRPSPATDSASDDQNLDESDEPDWDEIDDPTWNLITRCCATKPDDRPNASQVQELIRDLERPDARPDTKNTSDPHLLTLRSNTDIDLNRTGGLLNELQVQFLAQSILRYSTQDVIAAVTQEQFGYEDTCTLVDFWDLVLEGRSLTSESNQALALLSALVQSTLCVPLSYILQNTIQHNRTSIGSGSFGTVHQGFNPNLCIKVAKLAKLNPDFSSQLRKALPPFAHSRHPNVLPFYGIFFKGTEHDVVCFFVSPFMKNGNLHNYSLRLPQEQKIPLIFDIIEAVMYLHGLGIVHGNLKGENILISDEGRALVADFRPYHVNAATSSGGPTGSYATSTLRFTAPELVKDIAMLPTTQSDIWSIGCLIYQVLSRKVPFYQHARGTGIRLALLQGEFPVRPASTTDDTYTIDDKFWDLVTRCCAPEPGNRSTLPDVQKWLANLGIQDSRPSAKPLPGSETLKLRVHHPGFDVEKTGDILARIKLQLSALQKRRTGPDIQST